MLAGRIEYAVERGEGGAVGRGVVHGCAEYIAVGLLEFFGDIGNAVVTEYAPVFAALSAAAAAYAAAHGAVAQPDYLAVHSLIFEFFGDYRERRICAAVFVGAAIEHYYLHKISPYVQFIFCFVTARKDL